VTIVIFGAAGNIGRRLMAAFPGSIGVDRAPGADIEADLGTANFTADPLARALAGATAVIHVATEPQPQAPHDAHFAAVTGTARLVEACLHHRVPRLILPSSGWADPKPEFGPINPYGQSKRVMEAMAEMYRLAGLDAVALRFGWVPRHPGEFDAAPPYLRADYWPDTRLIAEVTRALGR
jgi:nucleoside-diphosphate-sugar epimerase